MLFALLLFVSTSLFAQKIQLKTTTGTLFTYGAQYSATTTNATADTVATIPLAANTAGLIRVSVVGVNTANGDAITGSAIVRYKKASGTLTIGDTSNISPTVVDTGISGATWNIATSANSIIISATGKASTTIRWRFRVEQLQ